MEKTPTKPLLLWVYDDLERVRPFWEVLASEYQIEGASTPEEGVQKIGFLAPQFVIAGFFEKDFWGERFFEACRKECPFDLVRTTWIFFLSAHEIRMRHGEALIGAGLSGWYMIPLDPLVLRDILFNFSIQGIRLRRQDELVQEARLSEFRYRDLIENAGDLILTLDEDDHISYLNNRFTALTGFEKSEWIGRSFLALIHEENRRKVADYLEQVRRGRSRLFETEIVSALPDPPVLSFSLTPLFKQGNIRGMMGIGRDMTEQKCLERDIHDLETFNTTIIQSMESGLITLDLSGRITSLNQAGEKILGWKSEEVVGRTLDAVFPPEEVQALMSDEAQVAPLTLNQETRLTVRSGRKIYIGFNKSPWIDHQGEKLGTLLSFRDITQLKEMQTEVLRMDRLASLGVLASGIAHEIKNPLAGIKTMAQACEEEMEVSDPRREYLERIIRQVDRLDDLLKTFFSFARPKKPERASCDILDILKEVTRLVSKKLADRRIQLVIDQPKPIPRLFIDFQQMQQVFLNLLLNAIDAMPQGGTITIQIRADASFDSVPGNKASSRFVTIVFSDTGSGIPAEILSKVFDPFFTTKTEGLGLGLSIVYRIVQEHGGEVKVESEPNHGTTFYILLPIGEP